MVMAAVLMGRRMTATTKAPTAPKGRSDLLSRP
jgi:hypothetical protein